MNPDPTSDNPEHAPGANPDPAEGAGDGGRSGGGGNGGDGGNGDSDGGDPRHARRAERRAALRRGRWLRAAVWPLVALAALVVVALGSVLGAIQTEKGTRHVWQAAVQLLDGHLSGTFEGGALATGVRFSHLRWHDAGTDIEIDRFDGRWRLTRRPLKFTIDYVRAGTIDVRIAPSTSTTPMTLPRDLRVPLALDIEELRVSKVRIHDGDATTEFTDIAARGRTDGRHHEVAIDSFVTPWGALTAAAKLDGVRPFALSGDAGWSGKVSEQEIKVGARVSGSLETLTAEVDASGMQLVGHASAVAMPFADVPLKTLSLAFEHVDPRAFSASAPSADLSVHADVAPVAPTAGSTAFTVAGTASIVNATPGLIGDGKLPLIDAHAQIHLDPTDQAIDGLQVRIVKDASVTGSGRLHDGKGQFDLRIANFDLRTLTPAVRETRVGGPVRIVLKDGAQQVEADLADPALALRAQAAVSLTPSQTQIDSLKLQLGKGRVEASGSLKHDLASRYSVKATLTDFDPFVLLASEPVSKSASKSAPKPVSKPASKAASKPIMPPSKAEPAVQADAGGSQAVHGDAARASAAVSASAASASAAVAGGTPAGVTTATPVAHTAPAHPSFDPRDVRISGTLSADGTLAAPTTVKATFTLRDAVYAGLPMTGAGTVALAGMRLLPSHIELSVAGNDASLKGGFGGAGDHLLVHVDAPALERLGFGVAGFVKADADLTGTLAHPNASATYDAEHLVFGDNRVGHAQGRAELRDGANGALSLTLDARDVAVPGVEFATLAAHLSGTRAAHTFDASATGKVQGHPVDLGVAGRGALTEARGATAWSGTISALDNRGSPRIALQSPVQVAVADQKVSIGDTKIAIDTATLALGRFELDHGRITSAGSLSDLALARVLAIQAEFSGTPSTLRTDLVFDADWDFTLANTASGHLAIQRRTGDLQSGNGRGVVPLGLRKLAARVDFEGANRAHVNAAVDASRIGTASADLTVELAARDGMLTFERGEPISGHIQADVPALKTTGELFGPAYLLAGRAALALDVSGEVGRLKLNGALTGDDLSVTAVDQQITLKNGIVRIDLTDNRVDLKQVEFHGADGLLKATGEIQLDRDDPQISAQIIADKLQIFASPDRQLSLSGSADLKHSGPVGGLAIDGKFVVDHAQFDLPESAAPALGDDVKIVRSDGELVGAAPATGVPAASEKPVSRFAPRANVSIDLGQRFYFKGSGADMALRGAITVVSAPNEPLRADGNVRVEPGSTYEAFGRKLDIENGYFTFNGPVDNPGINILAMRRNQEYEAGVQVTGTVRAPIAKLVSIPDLPDSEKLSWLLFGHGTDTTTNLGQQNTMSTALALLGSTGGKRIAQTFGLDEFTIGQSQNGLTDPQVVQIAKAINEHFVFGYEQGLQTAQNLFKITWTITRNWSLAIHSGTLNGVDVAFNRRFD
ncbi:translocation/assembly module TamB domain-containing protein [Pararobbsia silviterrae]|uniref:Translocation and assembly module protein TamB n=1 Tax=Pararobbsia silviterrae TaxID=1792498 RepID=A0A494Y3U2_9BURK|nr:translocation/assembly module TamB domain-containing protein [Pararobbsia silviterrae]RKP56688.1 translocation and assembly module protein TamB [Pararobbsia silviterrae]